MNNHAIAKYLTMVDSFKNDGRDAIIRNMKALQEERPEIIRAVQAYYLTEVKNFIGDGARNLAIALENFSFDLIEPMIETDTLGEEALLLLSNNVCLYAFVLASFTPKEFQLYYQLADPVSHLRGQQISLKDAQRVVKEFVFVLLLRLDPNVRILAMEAFDNRARHCLHALAPAKAAHPAAMRELIPRRFCFADVEMNIFNNELTRAAAARVDDLDDYVKEDELVYTNHNCISNQREVRRYAKKVKLDNVIKLREVAARKPQHFSETYIAACIKLVVRSRSVLPTFLQTPEDIAEVLDKIHTLVLYIPIMLLDPDMKIYSIMQLYSMLSIANRKLNVGTAEGLYMYISYFTLTHLRICVSDVRDRVMRYQLKNNY